MKKNPETYTRVGYEQVATDLATTKAEKESIQAHYDAELAVHASVRKSLLPDQSYPFHSELLEIEHAKHIELAPLDQKYAQLQAKLNRLYALAWNEAKEEDLGRKHKEMLPVMDEAGDAIDHIRVELEASNPAFLFAASDAEKVLSSLRELLATKHPTLAGEKDIQEHIQTLYELLERAKKIQHSAVHSDHTPPERKS